MAANREIIHKMQKEIQSPMFDIKETAKEYEECINKIYNDIEQSIKDTFHENRKLYQVHLPTEEFVEQLLARINILNFIGDDPKEQVHNILLDNPCGYLTALVVAKLILTHPLKITDKNIKKYILEIEKPYDISPSCALSIMNLRSFREYFIKNSLESLHIDTKAQKASPDNIWFDKNTVAIAFDIRAPFNLLKNELEKLILEKRKITTKEDTLNTLNLDKLQYEYKDKNGKLRYGHNMLYYIDFKILKAMGFAYYQKCIALDINYHGTESENYDSSIAKAKTTLERKFKEITNIDYVYRLLHFLEKQKTMKNKRR